LTGFGSIAQPGNAGRFSQDLDNSQRQLTARWHQKTGKIVAMVDGLGGHLGSSFPGIRERAGQLAAFPVIDL
jgi:hypothetical protein